MHWGGCCPARCCPARCSPPPSSPWWTARQPNSTSTRNASICPFSAASWSGATPPITSHVHIRPLADQPPDDRHVTECGRVEQLLLHGTTPTLASSPSAQPHSTGRVSALPVLRGGHCSEGGLHVRMPTTYPPPPTPPHLHPFRETVKGWVSFHPTRPGGQRTDAPMW
jgi:hypothetical protein